MLKHTTDAPPSYVDVILPLPLPGVFTYALPPDLAGRVEPGMRLLVPLGKSKRYIAVATRVHADKPDFDCKPVAALLDLHPSLLPQQLRLWQWIADYYMATPGDVYNAALPAGMKTVGKYRPKTEAYVGLAEAFRSEQAIGVARQMLARATGQLRVFEAFLAMSHWDTPDMDGKAEVARDELMNTPHCTAAMVKALVDRGILYNYNREVGRLNTGQQAEPGAMKPLSEAQAEACDGIRRQMESKNVVLLHGVTSSGKTEIYIHLIQQALDNHQQVLYLLPEIALTVQIMSRLRRVFGSRLGIYHSKYSDAERVEIWQKQLSPHPYDIILGPRSAVFLPFQKLGLVIIDEEHETSFKQQDPAPRYHARSAAIVLARMYGAKTLLGTATPSLESYHNAETGKYGLVELTTRYQDVQLPKVEVVDVKDLRHRKMMTGPFSPRLLTAVRQALASGRQAILFQNRRGFAPRIECKVCGWVPKCENCDVSLTYHRNLATLTCHYCGSSYVVPTVCPNCGSTELVGRGYGTEKIEDEIAEILPEARIARMDLDTTRSRNAYERIIGDFAARRTNLLIGTQMVSKGLDFDGVSVVGILDADSMLNYPDFRAYEHAFTMMSQVSGRAGRKGSRGLVILQTRDPESEVIRQVVDNDYPGFYRAQMEERAYFRYPPFTHLVYVYLRHRHAEVVDHAAQELGLQLRQWFGERVLGPDKPAVARVKAMDIRKIVLKLENGLDLKKARGYLRLAQEQMAKDPRYGALQVYFDVDPM